MAPMVESKSLPIDKMSLSRISVGIASVPGVAESSAPDHSRPSESEVGGQLLALGAASTAAPGMDDDEELDEEMEAKMLGIPLNKRKAADQKNDKWKKVRKSKEEIQNEELDKMQVEITTLTGLLPEWPKKPSGYDLGKVDRILTSKGKSYKDNNFFEGLQKIEAMQREVKNLRDCMQAAQKYIPARGLPKKAHADLFYQAFSKAQGESPTIFYGFPSVVLQHFFEISHVKMVEARQWGQVGEALSKEKLQKIWPDDDEAEKQGLAMLETMVSSLLLLEPTEAAEQLMVAFQKILGKNPTSSFSAPLPLLVQIIEKKPDATGMMDSAINAVQEQESQPVIRVFMASETGKTLLSQAEEANRTMRARASKLSSLGSIKDLLCVG